MLYAISNGFIEGYTNGQDEIIHLVVDAEKIDRNGLPYTFTDMHAVMIMCRFFTDLVHLDQIDWKLMRSRYWFDTNDYPDRKQRRQAEFLVYSQLEWNFIEEIGVRLERTSRQVREIIEQTKTTHIPDINVHREWYY